MKDFSELQTLINNEINKISLPKNPSSLYDPIRYILSLRAKRMRSIALLTTFQLYNHDLNRAINAALAIELFHNFTLIHDDIMDKALIRRGSETVHEKWNENTAILSGDTMLVKSYSLFLNLDSSNKNYVLDIFSKTAMMVCEGQQMDMDYENMNNPGIDQYLEMIKLKTSVLLAASFQIGALIGGASKTDALLLYEFGIYLGIAFQITDDLIGIMGNSKVTKKPVGNDIREGKKSLPILLAIRKARGKDKQKIMKVFGKSNATKKDVQTAVNTIRSLGIEKEVRKKALQYATKATKSLDSYSGSDKKEMVSLLDFVVKRSL